jgi:hypothetical protein
VGTDGPNYHKLQVARLCPGTDAQSLVAGDAGDEPTIRAAAWIMGSLLGLALAALPLSLEGIFVCTLIVGSLEMELRVHRLPPLVSGTAQKSDGIYPAPGIFRIINLDQ